MNHVIAVYLAQMGEIPLLDRKTELQAARQIAMARRRFRQTMLATDFVLREAIVRLKDVFEGRARRDCVLDVSATDGPARRRLATLLGPDLNTLGQLVRHNRAGYVLAINKRQPAKQRHEAWAGSWHAAAARCGWSSDGGCERSFCGRFSRSSSGSRAAWTSSAPNWR